MLVEFGREISPFKFSGEMREKGFKFCRFLREALPHVASFEILMFRFSCGAALRLNFILCRLQVANFPRYLNFKFNCEAPT